MLTINDKMQACIDSCYQAITSCKVCLDQHLGEAAMRKCHQLCLDCIDLATACASLCAANSAYINKIANLCAQVCRDCAAECAKFDSDVCKQCVKYCQTCAEQCEAMA